MKTSQAVGFVLQLLINYYPLLQLAILRLAKRSCALSKVHSSCRTAAHFLLYDDAHKESIMLLKAMHRALGSVHTSDVPLGRWWR